MPRAIIVIDFQDGDGLTEKLDFVREELHGDISDRPTQLPPGLLWQGDDYSLYLVPDGFTLSAEKEVEESDRNG